MEIPHISNNKLFTSAGREFPSLYAYVFIIIVFSLSLFSCRDELTIDDSGLSPGDSTLQVVDLPGVIGVNLFQTENIFTRSDNTSSDGHAFNDGIAKEYELSDPIGDEYYHYLLLYKSADSNSTPLIFPLDVSGMNKDSNPNNNVTSATVSKTFTNGINGELNNREEMAEIKSLPEFISYLEVVTPYVLLNFKMEDGEGRNHPNYSLFNGIVTGNNTVEKLSKLTRSDLESLQMKDYKVSGRKTVIGEDGNSTGINQDFFLMTSSVYSDNTKKVIDGHIDTDKIFTNIEDAKAQPALNVHLDRVAAKVTVSFDVARMAAASFDPYGNQSIQSVSVNQQTGLPQISLKVQKVDMSHEGGITFDKNGYKIETDDVDATIRILGYGLSNLEESTFLFKTINPAYGAASTLNWFWNDPSNFRSYWAQDQHYNFNRASTVPFTKIEGYPHQFRIALDTDTVSSLHIGPAAGYNDYDNPVEYYYIGEGANRVRYEAYKTLGKINVSRQHSGAYLKYKSFDDINADFHNFSSFVEREDKTKIFSFAPFYALENTYFDQGMASSANWRWPWYRAPYAAATNLIVLAEIELDNNLYNETNQTDGLKNSGNNVSKSLSLLTREGEETSVNDPAVRTVYLGQNNIFYLKLENLLKSKLAILNQVMLSGGNAGIQILHGQWDRHTRWEEDDENQNNATHLDKVAWNEGSKLWFGKVKWKDTDKTVAETEDIKDSEGKVTGQRVVLDEQILLEIKDNIVNYLTLIPAEISGGDGQELIAPHEDYMGKDFKYYLAPSKKGKDGNEVLDENGKTLMDMDMAVEISYNHLVALIHKIIGPIDVYRNGKMYFSVPIPHRISSFNSTNGNNAWKSFGSFSLVRNNWYNISINEITRLGTPVDDPSQPIIPVMDVRRSYINMGVELKEWHDLTQDNIPIM